MVFEEKIVEYFTNIYALWRPGKQSNTGIYTKSIRNKENCSINISVKNPNIPIESSYPTRTKTQLM